MRIARILGGMLALVLLTSCAGMQSTVVFRMRLDKEFAGKLAFTGIEAQSSVRRFTQADLDQLKEAVRARAPQPASGGVPVTIQMTVTDYGPGASGMTVAVRVVDAAGKLYAQFDVHQTANAVLGTVYDQRSSVINAVADRVAYSLMALPSAPAPAIDARDYGS
ncbi:MAG: hypothetical protein U1F58_00025 [Burkholderiales bacterium]